MPGADHPHWRHPIVAALRVPGTRVKARNIALTRAPDTQTMTGG
jgi:hypothetical protein